MTRRTLQPTILVIIGITGDLARRKLLPAIAEIAKAKALPPDFLILGVSRQAGSAQTVLEQTAGLSVTQKDFLANHLQMYQMDISKPAAYKALRRHLEGLQRSFATPGQILFYLSVPPQVSRPLIASLGTAGFGEQSCVKLLLEKPFGSDLATAESLVAETSRYFDESQLYRIDHYLAKEMVQDILVFRSQNALFRQTWNNQFIEKIDIIASETIGIEGRAAFYEQTGALRDIIQNHLLQLAALTLMNIPAAGESADIPQLRQAALEALRPPQGDDLERHICRGQYRAYRQETGNPHTNTETFVSAVFFSRDERWQGVPIRLTAGKNLARKTTEISIHYKKQAASEANVLTLRIQPQEGIEMLMWAKKPGYHHRLERLPLRFTYQDHYQTLPEAYERVLVDAICSDHRLFASSAEVLAAWRLLAPIQACWDMKTDGLFFYEAGADPKDLIGN